MHASKLIIHWKSKIAIYFPICFKILTLIWVVRLELRYELEISYVSTHSYVVSENIPFSTKAF